MRNTWLEASINDLYNGSVKAFPKTTKRQHATDSVKIEHLEWVPFLGVRTLFVKAQARNEGRKNEPIILFKGVKYASGPGRGIVPLVDSSGKTVHLESISAEDADVLVRCSCGDFMWRFNYYNSLDKSLFGRKRSKYEGQGLWEANPSESPGFCKHLMKMAKVLREAGLVSE